MRKFNKIFCLGLNKTGTKSLHTALEILVLKSSHFTVKEGNMKQIVAENHKKGLPLMTSIEDYDVYIDWNTYKTGLLFKQLEEQYPGSLFILNTRDLNSWISSRKKHIQRNLEKHPEKRLLVNQPGWYKVDVDKWVAQRRDLHKKVLKHFGNRDDFIIVDVCSGEGWKKICKFLQVDIPEINFPHKNKSPNGTTN